MARQFYRRTNDERWATVTKKIHWKKTQRMRGQSGRGRTKVRVGVAVEQKFGGALKETKSCMVFAPPQVSRAELKWVSRVGRLLLQALVNTLPWTVISGEHRSLASKGSRARSYPHLEALCMTQCPCVLADKARWILTHFAFRSWIQVLLWVRYLHLGGACVHTYM
jgi:hypothetical protein